MLSLLQTQKVVFEVLRNYPDLINYYTSIGENIDDHLWYIGTDISSCENPFPAIRFDIELTDYPDCKLYDLCISLYIETRQCNNQEVNQILDILRQLFLYEKEGYVGLYTESTGFQLLANSTPPLPNTDICNNEILPPPDELPAGSKDFMIRTWGWKQISLNTQRASDIRKTPQQSFSDLSDLGFMRVCGKIQQIIPIYI